MTKIEGKGESHMKILLQELFVSNLKLWVNLQEGNVYKLMKPSMEEEAHTFNW